MNADVYIFVSKRRNRAKLLHYETGGMVIYAKMLDRGTFGMPIPGSKDVVTSSIKWEDLLKMVLPGDTEVQGNGREDKRLHDERLVLSDV